MSQGKSAAGTSANGCNQQTILDGCVQLAGTRTSLPPRSGGVKVEPQYDIKPHVRPAVFHYDESPDE